MSKFLSKVVTGVSSIAMASMMLVTPVATHAATAGEVYKGTDGTVYFITKDMQKRPFTSWGAFQSYGFLTAAQIKDADAAVNALPTGSFIAPQDGRIFCATATKDTDVKGECSLITGGKKAAFTSASVFTGQGFSFANAYNGDSSFLAKTGNIDNAAAGHSAGVLVNNGGTIQLVVTGGLWGVPSMDVFNSWGWKMSDVVTANAADKTLSQTGVIPSRMAGDLVPTATTAPVATGDCTTGEGSVDDFSTGSADETTVHEDQNDVELVAFDVELTDDGCLSMDRFDLYMAQATGGDSTKPWDYFTDAHLLVNGEEVASMSVDSSADWSVYTGNTLGAANEYRLRFSGLSGYLEGDEVTTVSVAFDTVSNLDSADEDAVWQFGTEVDSFRFTDGTGFTFTDGEDLASSFAFEAADQAALEISASNDDTDARVIKVKDTSDTNGEEIGMFDIEETENVDVNITEMEVVVATSDTVTDVFKKLYLYDGSTLVGQENVTGATVTFDNLNLDVAGDETVTLTIKADFRDTNTQVRYADGATVEVDDVNITKFTDEMENDEGDITPSGTYASETFELRVNGITVEFDSSATSATRTFTADEATEIDQGTFVIGFKVTAFGQDMHIDRSLDVTGADCAVEANAAGQGVEYCFDTTTAATMSAGSGILQSPTSEGANDTTDTFLVKKNTTRSFTLTLVSEPSADSQVQMRLESINYGTATGDTNTGYYNFNLTDFKTPYLYLNVY